MAVATLDEFGRRRGADVLMEVLRSGGVRYIFGNPGTTELPLIDALTEASDTAYVLALQDARALSPWPAATPRPPDGPGSSICKRQAVLATDMAIPSMPGVPAHRS